MKNIKFVFLIVCLNYIAAQNPFSILGIPSLKPGAIFSDDDDLMNNKEKLIRHNRQNVPVISDINDLQNYLKKKDLDENEGLNVVSRFLISEDHYSKQNGVVFDVTGFDGLATDEKILAPSLERDAQRARSAGRIHFQKMYNDESYEPIGAQQIETYNEDWKIFKVLMASKATLSQQIILKACLPKNEAITAIVSDINGACSSKINFIDDLKNKGKPYLDQIRRSHVFRAVKSNKQDNNNQNQADNNQNNNNQNQANNNQNQQQQMNNNQNQQQQMNNNQQQQQQMNNNQQQMNNNQVNNNQQQFNNNQQQQQMNNPIRNQSNQSEIKKLNNSNINQNIIQNNPNLMQNNAMKNNINQNLNQNTSFMQKNENRKKDDNISNMNGNINNNNNANINNTNKISEKDKSNTANTTKKINEVIKTPTTNIDQKVKQFNNDTTSSIKNLRGNNQQTPQNQQNQQIPQNQQNQQNPQIPQNNNNQQNPIQNQNMNNQQQQTPTPNANTPAVKDNSQQPQTIKTLSDRVTNLENIIKNLMIQTQNVNNDIFNIKTNTETNFQKVTTFITQLSQKIK